MNREILFDYVKEKYGTEPEYLWRDSPAYSSAAVLRHSGNKKWYGIVMRVSENKLGLGGTETTDILNVKCDPIMADILRGQKGFLPGYHMNKKYWISIILDETAEKDKVFDLLDMSFENTAPKPKRSLSGKTKQ